MPQIPIHPASATSTTFPLFPAADVSLTTPQAVHARYRLGRRLGRSGSVYQALNPRFEIPLAVKLFPYATALPMSVVAAFARDARAIATLDHPAIVRVLHAGQFAGATPFVAMEQLRGESLESWLTKHGPMAAPDVLRVIRSLASALSAAHTRGVIHRDVCANNVFMQDLPGRELGSTRLLDFGVAHLAHAARQASRTDAPEIPPEAAPEQKRHQTSQQDRASHPGRDERVDQYALAALTYRLLTGGSRLPHDSPYSVFERLREVRPRPLAFPAGFTPAIEAVLSRGLQRRADDRYISVGAFFEALETSFGDQITSAAAILDREDVSARAIRVSAVVDWGGPDASAFLGPPPPAPEAATNPSSSLTQRFFLEGERQEAVDWEDSPLAEEDVPDPEATFGSFDKVPKFRGPLLAVSAALAAALTVVLWFNWEKVLITRQRVVPWAAQVASLVVRATNTRASAAEAPSSRVSPTPAAAVIVPIVVPLISAAPEASSSRPKSR